MICSAPAPKLIKQMSIILDIQGLSTVFESKNGPVKAVDDVSITLFRGEQFGLVGESGSGKSATCRSIIQLIPSPPGKIVSGSILFEGHDLLKMSRREIRAFRGAEISMIFQDPMTSLNPVMSIGYQVAESLREHKKISRRNAREEALRLLRLVGVYDPEKRFSDYPHNFSGGMRQRVLIAMALALKPKILLADEPTTALDVTIQDQILKLIASLQKEFDISVILVSHDLGVIAQTCHRIAVMYAGQIVEVGHTIPVFNKPLHPYTQALMQSIPQGVRRTHTISAIKGAPPYLAKPPEGCRFHPRCSYVQDACRNSTYALREIENGHFTACINEGFIQR